MAKFTVKNLLLLLLSFVLRGQDFDLLIRGGRVVDGTGNPSYLADVALKDGRVAGIGRLEGKTAKRVKAGQEAIDKLKKWHERLAGLDADVEVHRAALRPAPSEQPKEKIEFLLSHLRDRTPDEVQALYNSASDGERQSAKMSAKRGRSIKACGSIAHISA